MRKKENAPQVQSQLENLIQLCEAATKLHDSVLPLLPEDEQERQKEWFTSIEKNSSAFKEDVKQWLTETEKSFYIGHVQSDSVAINEGIPHIQSDDVPQVPTRTMSPVITDDIQDDDVKPSDSVSNVESRRSGTHNSATGRKSSVSTTSSARIKAEADLAALMARQKLLKDKHALEEQEEHLRKRKEKLNLEEEIAAHMAKVSVLRASSVSSAKSAATEQSNGMKSYYEKAQRKTQTIKCLCKFICSSNVWEI